MLPCFPEPPNTLHNLMNINGNNSDARYFMQHMREFNSGMSMATIQMKHNRPEGQSMIRIQGQVVRRVGAITTSNMNNSRFIQTYWLESEVEAQRRTSLLVNFFSLQRSHSEKEKIKNIFTKCCTALNEAENSYIECFKAVNQLAHENNMTNFKIGFHADKRPTNEHERRFNAPASSEVAILMPNEINKEDKRMVVANYRQNANLPNFLCHFNDTHRCHDPLCYPLLFPFGTDGWNPELKPVNPPQPIIN